MPSLNGRLTSHQFSTLKLALFTLGVPFEQLNQAKSFSDLYNLYLQKCSSSAEPGDAPLSTVLQILARIGVPERHLFYMRLKLKSRSHSRIEDQNQLTDLVLTLCYVLKDLKNEDYVSFESLALKTLFPHWAAPFNNGKQPRTFLVEQMLYNNCLTIDNVGYICSILEVLGCSTHRWYLSRYFHCHNIKEPNWEVLIPVVGEKISTAQDDDTGTCRTTDCTLYSAAPSSLATGVFSGKQAYMNSEKIKDKVVYKRQQFNPDNRRKMKCVDWCYILIFVMASIAIALGTGGLLYFSFSCDIPKYIQYNTTLHAEISVPNISRNITVSNVINSNSFLNDKHYYSYLELDRTDNDYYTLPEKSIYLQMPRHSRIGINYYESNGPIYTSGPGVLVYEITAVFGDACHNQKALEFHLFNDASGFYEFLLNDRSDSAIYTYGINATADAARDIVLKLTLPNSGFYFVGVYSKLMVFLTAKVSAYLPPVPLGPVTCDTPYTSAYNCDTQQLSLPVFESTQKFPSLVFSNKTSSFTLSYKMAVFGEEISQLCYRGFYGTLCVMMSVILLAITTAFCIYHICGKPHQQVSKAPVTV